MDKKIFIAAIVGAIVSFFLGWLVFGILMKDYYDTYMIKYEGLLKDPPNLYAIFLSGLCWTFLLAYIFSRWAVTNTFAKGAMNAMLIGFLITLSYDLFFFASWNLYAKRLLAVDVVVSTVFSAIIGGVVGWMLGMGKKSETT